MFICEGESPKKEDFCKECRAMCRMSKEHFGLDMEKKIDCSSCVTTKAFKTQNGEKKGK